MKNLTRREFVAATSTAAALALTGSASASTQDAIPLRIGLVGCGGRGGGAAENCLASSKNLTLVSLGDLFQDRLVKCRGILAGKGHAVKDENCFTGFDAYKRVIDSGVDVVLFATPPGFRPGHVEAAVEAGRHVFMEKPVAVDPVGVRRIIKAGETAKGKRLSIVAGTQRRHAKSYIETIKRIHDGAIGEVVAARSYWNGGELWHHGRKAEWTDVDWQIRNWLYFCWLSGDHIVEQHIHNLDVINWVMGAHPVRAVGLGGRQKRTDPKYGNIFDHFAIDYEYPNGAHMMSMCRQMDGTQGNVSEAIVGTKGKSSPSGAISGENKWRFEGKQINPYVQEHADLIAAIRAGKPLNEAKRVAESTLTAIMGREACYTGKLIKWDELANSDMDLMPAELDFGDMDVDPIPMPGKARG